MIREYCDSDTLLAELRGSFIEGFNNYLRQVKTSFPDLDLSLVTIDAQAQTSIQAIHFESTDDLFADDAPVDNPRGDGETAAESQIKPVVDNTRHPNDIQFVEEKNENTPVQQ